MGALEKSLVSIITNIQVYRFAFRVWLFWINTVYVVNILQHWINMAVRSLQDTTCCEYIAYIHAIDNYSLARRK